MSRSASRRPSVILATYFALNTAFSLFSRYALGIQGFSFPFFFTAWHTLFGSLFTLPSFIAATKSARGGKFWQTLKRNPGVVLVALLTAANTFFSNWSLEYLDLSLNQVIRSSTPVATALIAASIERRWPPHDEVLGLTILCIGVSLAIGEAVVSIGNAFGVTLCLLSVVAGAANLAVTARVLNSKINSAQLALFGSPITFACLMPPSMLLERHRLASYFTQKPAAAAGILLAGSVIAGIHSALRNEVVAITDPVTTCVLGQIKMITLMVFSAYLFGEGRVWSRKMSSGIAIAIIGFAMYTWTKIQLLQSGGGAAAHDEMRTPGRGRRRREQVNIASPDAQTPSPTLPGLKTPTSRASTRYSPAESTHRMTTRARWRCTPASLV